MTTFTTRGEQDAYISGLDAHAEAKRLIASPEYAAGDPAVHALVRRHYLDAYGAGDAPVRTATGPGQVPMSPFAKG